MTIRLFRAHEAISVRVAMLIIYKIDVNNLYFVRAMISKVHKAFCPNECETDPQAVLVRRDVAESARGHASQASDFPLRMRFLVRGKRGEALGPRFCRAQVSLILRAHRTA